METDIEPTEQEDGMSEGKGKRQQYTTVKIWQATMKRWRLLHARLYADSEGEIDLPMLVVVDRVVTLLSQLRELHPNRNPLDVLGELVEAERKRAGRKGK